MSDKNVLMSDKCPYVRQHTGGEQLRPKAAKLRVNVKYQAKCSAVYSNQIEVLLTNWQRPFNVFDKLYYKWYFGNAFQFHVKHVSKIKKFINETKYHKVNFPKKPIPSIKELD